MGWSWVGLGLSLVGLGWVGSRVAMDRSRFGNGLVMGLTTVRLGSVFSVGPRRRDLILLHGDIVVHTVGAPLAGRQRNFLEVRFTTAAGASTSWFGCGHGLFMGWPGYVMDGPGLWIGHWFGFVMGVWVGLGSSWIGHGLATVRLATVRFGHWFRLAPRRQDSIALVGEIQVHTTNVANLSEERQRHFLEVRFKALTAAAGATPCVWKVVVLHTRSGSQIPGKNPAMTALFKKMLFKTALRVAMSERPVGVPGFVVGDLDMAVPDVREVLRELPTALGTFEVVGGQGGPWRVSCV